MPTLLPSDGYQCPSCGEWHEGPPLSYAAPAPALVLNMAEEERARRVVLLGETCVLDDQHFFVRARIEIPIRDCEEAFEWVVWVSLSESNFQRTLAHWDMPWRESDPPAVGWLSTHLSPYTPSTINLKTVVYTQPLGFRPIVEVEPTDHPLAIEQRDGITLRRVHEIAGQLIWHIAAPKQTAPVQVSP